MLDWLSSHQGSSATEDSQIPDAPETPAPIFAYRALKGILFGSPEYEDEDEDKENIAPAITDLELKGAPQVVARDVTADSSPLQRKPTRSPRRRTREGHPVSPSPRTRRQTSPTKSILRTPGIPTPRRQNANVTFKDVRPSISPVAVTTKLLAAQNELKAAVPRREAIKAATLKTAALVLPGSAKAADEIGVPTVPEPDMSSIDTYLKSTEREMKSLVRYSQKMKGYARISQQENVALRQERDQLKRELEELRNRKMKTKGHSDEQATRGGSSISPAKGAQHGLGKATGKSLRESSLDAKRPDKSRSAKAARLFGREGHGGDGQFLNRSPQGGEGHLEQGEARDILLQDIRQEVVSKKRAATTARLPPDRLAAAKERLRLKNEERRRALSAAVG